MRMRMLISFGQVDLKWEGKRVCGIYQPARCVADSMMKVSFIKSEKVLISCVLTVNDGFRG